MAGEFHDSDSNRPSEANSGDTSSRNEPLPADATPPYVIMPTVRFDTPVTGAPRHNETANPTQDSKQPKKRPVLNPPTIRSKRLKPITTVIGKKLKEGKRVEFGDYQLVKEIARGGMGVVFHAIQKGLNRDVALKVILAGQLATEEDVKRFQAEAEAAASLRHHAIVPIYEVGQCEGHHFFSMGLVDGSTLAEAVRESPMLGQEAARILSDVASAIAAAHDAGVIHRDLKPGNILLDRSARPQVTDFGLAKRADMDSYLTGTGQVIGTPNYMSPEQASGLNHLIGPRSDVYSLGAVLYFALTGRPPFQAATMLETLQQVIDQEPVPPHRLNGSIDDEIETICLKCLQKDPGSRYQSASELEADLERYRNLEPIHARPITRIARGWRWCLRNRRTAMLMGALAVLTLTLAIVGPLMAIREYNYRTQSDNLTIERATTLNKLLVERGNEAIKGGEPATALPYYAEALQRTEELNKFKELDEQESESMEWAHRVRIASVLQQAPAPTAFFELSSETYNACVSPSGNLIAANGRDGRLSAWRISDEKQLLDSVILRPSAGSCLQFFANDTRLLHASSTLLQIWDLQSSADKMKPEKTIKTVQCESSIRAAKIDASEKLLLLGLKNGLIQLRRASDGKWIQNLGWHQQRVNKIELHAKTNRMVTCSDDGTAMLFDLHSCEVEQIFEHSGPINWVEFDPSGDYVVTASDDGVARVWRTRDGEPVGPPLICDDRVRVARFDPTGSFVATGSWAALARVWNFKTGRQVCDPLEHENSIPHLQFSSDGKSLLTSSLDHMARIWNLETSELQCPPMLHGYLVNKSFFLPEQRLVTASADGIVRVWQYKPHALRRSTANAPAKITASALSGDGSFFAAGLEDGSVFVRDADSATVRGFHIQHNPNGPIGSEVNSIAISPDSKWIATASDDNTAKLFSSETGLPVESTPTHEERVKHVEFSHDGKFLLTVSDDATVKIWLAKSGHAVQTLRHPPRELVTASFAANSKWVVTSCRDGTVRIWDPVSGDQIGEELKHDDHVENAVVSPNGAWLVTCCRDHSAYIWDTRTWKRVSHSLEHSGGVVTASFSPDSNYVVTGARDGTARIWQVSNGAPVGSPLQVGRGLIRAEYSQCGKFIVTAGGRSAQLWDARDGKSLGVPMKHTSWVHMAQFSDDSRYLLSHTDVDATVWNVSTPDSCPIHELVDRAQLVSGHRISSGETLTPLPKRDLQRLLSKAKQRKLVASAE